MIEFKTAVESKIFIFFSLSVLTLVLGTISNNMLEVDHLIIDSLSQKLSEDQITQILTNQKKYWWLGYLLSPLILLLKISLISGILDIGCFLFNKKIEYKKLFKSVLLAEFIFILPIIFKTLWFYFFHPNFEINDLQNFYPLSAINIVGYESIDPWFVYPFQTLNLFELLYWFILAYFISKHLKNKFEVGLKIVSSSYGMALLIWVIAIMFIKLNIN